MNFSQVWQRDQADTLTETNLILHDDCKAVSYTHLSLNLLTIEEFLVDLGVASNIPEGEEEDYSEYYDVADAVKANTNYKIFENLPLPWSIPEKLLPVFAAF